MGLDSRPRNRKTYVGAGIAIVFAALVVYVPGLNKVVLGGGPVPLVVLVIPIIAGLFLILYEFVRRFLRKKGAQPRSLYLPLR